VGKIGVPDAVLRKPGPLDDDEWDIMRMHPSLGADMIARVPGLDRVAEAVRTHHERWDGGGYPDGLREAEIPLAGRIIAVCDAFNAMTSDRPYRPAMPERLAVQELRAGAGTQFDPRVVEVFVEVLGTPPVSP
jgi:HD-GYP domain-containing protein (c-di-GMP phosphodiesterase class II)